MKASDARRVLLVRAHEAPLSAPWTADDADGATREAARAAGESAADDEFVAARARIAAARLAEREPAAARALEPSDRAWIGWLVVALAFAAGIAGDAIGPAGRVNVLAPPLLVLLAWNIAAYVAMVLRPRAFGPLRRALARALERGPSDRGGPLARFCTDWLRAALPLHGARVATVAHAAAAALVLGALASMYLRGLVFEYRAGWESTFLDAPAVGALLAVVLGPASRLTGLPLPDIAQLQAIRYPGGENAAPWIHLYAVTAALVVLVPRGALAAFAAWRARRLQLALPLPLDDAYFRRLLRARSGRAAGVHVLPYSYRLPAELRAGLQRALEQRLGVPVALTLAEPLAPGDEDRSAAPPADTSVVALLSLAATPERETHGRFVQALAAHCGAGPLTVLVDESSFRLRFGSTRLAERRQAWQRMLGDLGHVPVFADLSA